MKNVTLRQLKVFEAVATHLSFSRAAEELHLTQPAVSMQVQALAELAGLPLFEQMGKKIYLTAAGEELLRHTRRIAQQLREAEEALAAIRGVQGGRLTLGVVSTAKYFAPRLLVAFRDLHPQADLHLVVSNRETIVRQLADNPLNYGTISWKNFSFRKFVANITDFVKYKGLSLHNHFMGKCIDELLF
jgi:DNA-binding transcriptional LysR family regulator